MGLRSRSIFAGVSLAAFAMVAASGVQANDSVVKAVSDPNGWAVAGHDYGNTRFSALKQITAPPRARILPQEVRNPYEPKSSSCNLRMLPTIQQPKLFVGQRKFPEYPSRHVVVCPRGFSCRIVETQLHDFSSEPDLGAIFVVLLMPADAFETTSRGCTQVCICGVLALRRFSQVRDPAA